MYKLRKSESNNSPLIVEYTQGGILMRFDIKEVEREDMEEVIKMYEYQEFWFSVNSTIDYIEKIVNEFKFKLTNAYKKLIS